MGRMTAFTEAQQLNLDDVLAEFRDGAPPGAAREGRKGASVITAGVDPDVIMADLETVGDVSQAEIGTEPHDGDCPHAERCELERQQRSYHLPSRCHWRAWGDWRRCPIYKNGGAK